MTAFAILFAVICFAGCSQQSDFIIVSDVTLDQVAISLVKNDSYKLVVTTDPTGVDVTWKTSDASVADVSEDGTVTAIGAGKATVTVVAGTRMATCDVAVSDIAPETVGLSKTEMNLTVCDKEVLTINTDPEEAGGYVVWVSSNDKVAKVDGSGTVEATGPGQAYISASIGLVRSEPCLVTVKDTIKVGDYYYSDGSYSTELDVTKTPVGVVFWKGDPTSQDAALKNEHPECTHGLAVALNNTPGGFVAWQSTFVYYLHVNQTGLIGNWIVENTDYETTAPDQGDDDKLHHVLGYNNTKGLEAFNAAFPDYKVDAVSEVVVYRDIVTLPEGTSGWYLPSAKELYIMMTGDEGPIDFSGDAKPSRRDVVNEAILKVEGAEPFDLKEWYWSSTEDKFVAKNAFDLRMFQGLIYISEKMSVLENVRPVFAF